MKPIINLDDPVVKTGSQPAPDLPAVGGASKVDVNPPQEMITQNIPRKGVYRFKTFEEADEWMEKRIIRRPKN